MISVHSLKQGMMVDRFTTADRTIAFGWVDEAQSLPGWGTHYGFVLRGPTELHTTRGEFTLQTGMYFAYANHVWLKGGSGLIVTRVGESGFFHLGGPIEDKGRLKYIDGCTDSVLIPPVVKGNACLNLLHVPPGTDQTSHTHPSLRVGLVVHGRGRCRTSDSDIPLSSGDVFVIDANEEHSFHTTRCQLRIIAYHPDSDFGPTNDDHPMLNRTIIN